MMYSDIVQKLKVKMQSKGYSHRTQQFYIETIEAFLQFHGARDPYGMGMMEIELFVAHRMKGGAVLIGLKQKLYEALLFFFTQVLAKAVQKEYIDASRGVRQPQSVPVVRRRRMVQQVMRF